MTEEPEEQKLMVSRTDSQPVGGWSMVVPHTGARLTDLSMASLKNAVRRHLEINGHRVPEGYDAWFEDYLCRSEGLLGSVCCEVPKVLPHQVATLEWNHIERFVKTIWQLGRGGATSLVTEQEAEERAAICAACPLNVSFHVPCRGCRGLIKRAAEVIGARTTSLDNKLEVCSACGCELKLKVHISNEVLDKAEGRKMPEYAKGCWRLKQ